MKKFSWIIPFILFAGLTYFSESNEKQISPITKSRHYSDGILRDEIPNLTETSNYNIKAELHPDEKKVVVEEELIWINKTNIPTKEIYLHFYPNAYKNNKTLFARGRGININEKTKSEIKVNKVSVNGKSSNLKFVFPDVKNPYDSTVAHLVLEDSLYYNDSVRISFNYELIIPLSTKRFGYAAGRNFFFISQWFIKAGVFTDGKWICNQYHPFTNYFADFGKYNVQIITPSDYLVGATGINTNQIKKNGKVINTFSQRGVHDFAWVASNDIELSQAEYKRKNGTGLKINLFLQPEHDKYKHRYLSALFNSLEFIESYIGTYPYQTLTLVDPPSTSQVGGMEYPTLITTGTELFSPEVTFEPEKVTVHEFIHQYFYGVVANNEVNEAWLDEGLASYLETKIMKRYYGNESAHFKAAKYYPVFGLNFLSFHEIPLIYSIGNFYMPEGTYALNRFYNSLSFGAIADTSFKLPDASSYGVLAYAKPEIAFLTLENYLSFRRMMKILKEFYKEYKFEHPTGKDLMRIIQRNTRQNMRWFFDSYFYGTTDTDYRIRNIKPGIVENEYEVFVEKNGPGIFRQDVYFYTTDDTLIKRWDGIEQWKKITFKTPFEVIGAEIDPSRKNLFDKNFANNSYMISTQFGGSLSLSSRWFFWMQNLLLILGSIA